MCIHASVQAFGEVRTLYTALRSHGLVLVVYFDLRASMAALRTLQGTLVRTQPLEIHYYRAPPKQGVQESGVNQVGGADGRRRGGRQTAARGSSGVGQHGASSSAQQQGRSYNGKMVLASGAPCSPRACPLAAPNHSAIPCHAQGMVVLFNLDPDTTNEHLVWIFSKFGDVKDITDSPHRSSQKHITFFDVRHAVAALKAMNHAESLGKLPGHITPQQVG